MIVLTKKGTLVYLVFLLLLSSCAANSFAAHESFQSAEMPKQSSNEWSNQLYANNSSKYTEAEGYYYTFAQDASGEKVNLVKLNSNWEIVENIDLDYRSSPIAPQYSNGYIYYTFSSIGKGATYQLYRYCIDTQTNELIDKIDDYILKYLVFENTIYFMTIDNSIKSWRIDSSEVTTLVEQAQYSFYVTSDSKVIYDYDDYLWCYDFTSGLTVSLSDRKLAYSRDNDTAFQLVGTKVWFYAFDDHESYSRDNLDKAAIYVVDVQSVKKETLAFSFAENEWLSSILVLDGCGFMSVYTLGKDEPYFCSFIVESGTITKGRIIERILVNKIQLYDVHLVGQGTLTDSYKQYHWFLD